MLTQVEEERVARAIKEVQEAHRRGLIEVGVAPSAAASFTDLASISVNFLLTLGPGRKDVVKAMEDLKARGDDWSTRMLQWVRAGRKPDGVAYTLNQWLGFGAELLDAIRVQTGYAHDGSAFRAVQSTGAAVVQDVQAIAAATAETAAAIRAAGQAAWGARSWILAGGGVLALAGLAWGWRRVNK